MPGEHHTLRPPWRDSERFVPRTFVRPVFRLLEVESFAGIVMLVAAVAALLWANSPWHGAYESLWATPLRVEIGSLLDLDLSLRSWVNDAAMALFFLLAGLEIKRELVLGDLRSPRNAALPGIAALGGMIVPALVFLAFNAGQPGERGWGIPVATDIAFAVGIVALAGRRIPVGAKIFILTLAVVDDIGGIVVIAVFYATDVSVGWLVVGAGAIVMATLATRLDVRSVIPYALLGAACWLAFHEAGIEAAIVGVVFGLLTPSRPFHDPERFAPVAGSMLTDIIRRSEDGVITSREREENEVAFEDLARFATECTSPLERVEARLAPWVTLAVVPLFAFANAGVRLDATGLDQRLFIGVFAGLVVGKAVGVSLATWLAVRTGLGRLPRGLTFGHVVGLAITAGMGFTVSLFVASLAFDEAALLSSAKLGVLAASAVAGAGGLLVLRAAGARASAVHTRGDSPDRRAVGATI